jgi:molybdopterin-biosynthesis enzyme MoeA-like protein
MRSIFRKSLEPEIKRRVGDLRRRAVTLKFEGVYESTMAPLIARELGRNPGVYIKSHPRGLKEGISRIEMDIVAVSTDPLEADRVAMGIASGMIESVRAAGGTLRSSRGME